MFKLFSKNKKNSEKINIGNESKGVQIRITVFIPEGDIGFLQLEYKLHGGYWRILQEYNEFRREYVVHLFPPNNIQKYIAMTAQDLLDFIENERQKEISHQQRIKQQRDFIIEKVLT